MDYHNLVNHSSADGHLVCFYLLAIVDNAAVNICVYVSTFSSLVYIPRSGIAGSYDNSTFNSLRICQTFPQCLHHFHSHQPCMRVPVSPHSHQHVIFYFIFIIVILMGVKMYLVVFMQFLLIYFCYRCFSFFPPRHPPPDPALPRHCCICPLVTHT
uniref:Uncharacterized protein n=1 Tax=Molossus molossus TaxID=27622 RepID=A0A7J8I8E0_MOLMO|nr:hypothetical protein HJG59_010634 [Molossus molossus]